MRPSNAIFKVAGAMCELWENPRERRGATIRVPSGCEADVERALGSFVLSRFVVNPSELQDERSSGSCPWSFLVVRLPCFYEGAPPERHPEYPPGPVIDLIHQVEAIVGVWNAEQSSRSPNQEPAPVNAGVECTARPVASIVLSDVRCRILLPAPGSMPERMLIVECAWESWPRVLNDADCLDYVMYAGLPIIMKNGKLEPTLCHIAVRIPTERGSLTADQMTWVESLAKFLPMSKSDLEYGPSPIAQHVRLGKSDELPQSIIRADSGWTHGKPIGRLMPGQDFLPFTSMDDGAFPRIHVIDGVVVTELAPTEEPALGKLDKIPQNSLVSGVMAYWHGDGGPTKEPNASPPAAEEATTSWRDRPALL
jgi:hypothetical protein